MTKLPTGGRVLPFARAGALCPDDLQAIAGFVARQPEARLQFVKLDGARTVALLEVAAGRLRIERRGEAVMARPASGGTAIERDSIGALLSAVRAWLGEPCPAQVAAEAAGAA